MPTFVDGLDFDCINYPCVGLTSSSLTIIIFTLSMRKQEVVAKTINETDLGFLKIPTFSATYMPFEIG